MGTILSGQVKWVLIGLMAIGGLAAVLGTASQAIWTDSDDVDTNSFDTGSVSLDTDKVGTIWTAVADGAPGAIATGELTVTNDGSMELRYAVTGGNVGDAGLPAGVNLRIGLEGPDGDTDCEFPYHLQDGSDIAIVDDVQQFTGTLDTAALMGSTVPGDQAGDRTLAAAAAEKLCFSVVLPDDAANSLQSLFNVTTFTFDSEQTANNP